MKEFSEDSWDRVWLNRTHMEPSIVRIRSIVEKFPRIERLDLIGENFLAVDTLIGLHKLRNLKKLVLKITKIEDKAGLLPLAKRKKLEELALLGEVFYLSGFDGLEELSFLKSLSFDKNTYFEYEERLDEHIHKWLKLETLNLTEYYEGDITPLAKCMNLKKLVVGKRLFIRGKKPLKENLPKGLQTYYENIEEKPEEYGTWFIIENKRKIF